MENKDDLIRKLKGILSRALNNPESEEAKTAMQIAGQFMAKYGLSMEDAGHREAKFTENLVDTYIPENDKWEGVLLGGICEVFHCDLIKFTGAAMGKRICRSVMGKPHEVELTIWYFKFLRLRIGRAAEMAYPRSPRNRTGFAYGVAIIVFNRLREMYKARKEAMGPETKALVALEGAELKQWRDERYPKITKSTLRESGSTAYAHGLLHGKNMSLNMPVAGDGSNGGNIALE